MTSKRKHIGWKITGLFGLVIIVLLLCVPFILPHFIKEKLTSLVDEKTDFTLEIGSMSFEGLSGISLHKIHLIPKDNKESYQKDGKYEGDWLKISIEKISIKGIKWKEFYLYRQLHIEKAFLLGPTLYAFRDKRKANAPFQFKPLPSRLLRQAKILVTVPFIEIKKGKMSYEEIPEKGSPTMLVHFTELDGKVHHLSTDSSYYVQHPSVKVEATGKVLGSIPARLTYSATTQNKEDAFTLEGSLAPFEARLLNQYLIPQASIELKSGRIDSLWFKWEANDQLAEGEMHMKYRDLKVQENKKNKPKKFVALKSLLSKLFVKKENLDQGKKDIGHVHFERIKNRSILNYIWNSFKTGFGSIVFNLPDKWVEKAIEKKAHHHKK